ncbi:MAG: type II secretion system protein GspL [Gammaproteobacteria bacterium]|nr:type II secretion system protein GspL [Gammaproteobacteria bacterium]MDH3467365.1 type II secretion system protein GspL [Gammaproteobacteria bacterium]
MTVYVSVNSPYRWAVLDRRGRLVDRGVADSLGSLAAEHGSAVTGVVPGQDVVIHPLHLPAIGRHKALSAIPYALEDKLSADIDTLHFVLLQWSPGSESSVAVVAKDLLHSWVTKLNDAGLNTIALVPEYCLLPTHSRAPITVAKSDDGHVHVRGPGTAGMSIDPAMLEFWWQEFDDKTVSLAVNDNKLAKSFIAAGASRVSEWSLGSDFTEWLSNWDDGVRIANYNLLQGLNNGTISGDTRLFKWAIGIAAATIILSLIADIAEYQVLQRKTARLDREIQAIFTTTFPEVTRIVNPRVQMEQQLRNLRSGTQGSGDFQYLLSALAQSAPVVQATVEEINYRDNTLLVICSTQDFAGLDRLRKRFEAIEGVTVQLLSSGSRDNLVTGRFGLQRGDG